MVLGKSDKMTEDDKNEKGKEKIWWNSSAEEFTRPVGERSVEAKFALSRNFTAISHAIFEK